MKMKLAAVMCAAALGASVSAASAQSAMDQMMGMMQCSASCNTQYLQCIGAANQLTSDPTQALNQIGANFQGSTACGQQAIQCQQSCS